MGELTPQDNHITSLDLANYLNRTHSNVLASVDRNYKTLEGHVKESSRNHGYNNKVIRLVLFTEQGVRLFATLLNGRAAIALINECDRVFGGSRVERNCDIKTGGTKKMKKFKCEVERTDEFEVEFDEKVITEEWMKESRSFFFDYYTLDEHADHIAQMRARFGRGFIEGYGIPLENGEVPYWVFGDDEKYLNKAININIVREDDDIHVEIS